jgi:hypothetical protein
MSDEHAGAWHRVKAQLVRGQVRPGRSEADAARDPRFSPGPRARGPRRFPEPVNRSGGSVSALPPGRSHRGTLVSPVPFPVYICSTFIIQLNYE